VRSHGSGVAPLTHERATGELAKMLGLIRQIRVALLTTVESDGTLHTRPVQTLAVEDDGTLWFFTDMRSTKADELRANLHVSLGYADPGSHHYVAVSGAGTVRRDPAKARELWQVEQRAYYPAGPHDQRLGLLEVRIERAEYWIAPGRVSYLFAALKAAVTGVPTAVVGENQQLK
jgi:general stress protein 26